ncbi:hypothetical protein L1276_001810 [Flavobacterium sp. HSC-32F16]|uniref:hypothetical protein n=1 Tax=Flavobacterium sp. HSC-32F16 TaxID=2910964 RepID=UPI0020A24B88|nr:hypothetical protein [Flavobacterium sp. HSC-32F16]MCP2026666.1 hypothetical protein [Flavobacterium sp. HSC-32F16]
MINKKSKFENFQVEKLSKNQQKKVRGGDDTTPPPPPPVLPAVDPGKIGGGGIS